MADLKKYLVRATETVKKNALLIVIIIVGAALILWPTKERAAETQTRTEPETEEERFSRKAEEERLRELLEAAEGVGKCAVGLSVADSGEVVYRENTKISSDGREERTTAVLQDGTGRQRALETGYRIPVYTGCVVVAEGADLSSVRLRITEAVMSLTGLSADKIAVIKMK